MPTATPAPTATPQPYGWPPVYTYLVDYLARHSPREFGTEDEAAAGDYLAQQMRDLGYEVSFQEFDFVHDESATLDVNGEALEVAMMDNSAPGDGSGPLVYVGLGREQDIPAGELEGAVALIKRGELTFQEKGANAAAAGAVAAVVFNSEPDLFGGYVQELDIPVLSLSGVDGEPMVARLQAGEDLSAGFTAEIDMRHSRNIVAHRAGTGEDGRTLILGAHYDTLPGAEGANDNAAGVSVLRMVAGRIGEMTLPFHVNVVFFGSGEAGIVGADHYAMGMSEEELENTMGMVNLDLLGTGLEQVLLGDPHLTGQVAEAGHDLGIGLMTIEKDEWWSNHTAFEDVGVPAVWLRADNLRQAIPEEGVDALKWINPALLVQAERTVTEFVRWLATAPVSTTN